MAEPVDEEPWVPTPALNRYHVVHGKMPKRIGFIEAARRMPWLARTFQKVVPQVAVTIVENEATVACPCGGKPAIAVNRVEPCPGECGRWFMFDGRRVRVARSTDA